MPMLLRPTRTTSPEARLTSVRARHALPAKERLRVGAVELAYVKAGPDSGPAVLWVHGFPRNAYVWRGCLGLAARAGYRCLAPDLLGLGESEGPGSSDFSPWGQARLLAELLNRERSRGVRIVGEGVGAAPCLALAVLRRETVRGVALLDPDFLDGSGSPLRIAAGLARVGYGRVVLGALCAARAAARLGHGGPEDGGFLERTRDLYLRPILAEPQSRGRATAFLRGLRPREATRIREAFLRAGGPPLLVCRGPWGRPRGRQPAAGASSGETRAGSEPQAAGGEDRLPRAHVLRLPDRAVRLLERAPEDMMRILLPFFGAFGEPGGEKEEEDVEGGP